MPEFNGVLLPTLGAVLLTWSGISAFVAASRAIYDLRRRSLRRIERLLDRRLQEAAELEGGASAVSATLRRLPRRTVERVAADRSSPEWIGEPLAEYAAERWGERLLRSAEGHSGEVTRWRRVAALQVLARAQHPRALELLGVAARDSDPEIAGAAVTILGGLREVRAAELLVQVLRDGTYSRSRVASQLDRFALDVRALIEPLAREGDPTLRFWAATLLSRYVRVGSPHAAGARR